MCFPLDAIGWDDYGFRLSVLSALVVFESADGNDGGLQCGLSDVDELSDDDDEYDDVTGHRRYAATLLL